MDNEQSYLLREIQLLNNKTAGLFTDSKNEIEKLHNNLDSFYDKSALELKECWNSCFHHDDEFSKELELTINKVVRERDVIKHPLFLSSLPVLSAIILSINHWFNADG